MRVPRAETIAVTPDGLYNLELSFDEGNIKGYVNKISVIDVHDANFITHQKSSRHTGKLKRESNLA
jgi:hypothetical protein